MKDWPYLFMVGASVALLGLSMLLHPPIWGIPALIIAHFVFVAMAAEAARRAEFD